ncbi:methyltransferase [Amycolatopsis minnesotensis]|uniref:Methyltransferase n=1 Tax=Amycolatopsis minnesotensis TaxID=337894 RepID=A0ABP5BXW2_9PSEU
MAQQTPRYDLDSVVRLAELADYIVPFAIRTACSLGVADAFDDGPAPVETLAERTGTQAPALLRLLRVLASRGIVAEPEPGEFTLTGLGRPLRADHPLSLRDTHSLFAADVLAWSRLDVPVRTGAPAFDVVHGTDYWTHLAANPDDSASVDRWMRGANRLHLRTVLPAYPWGTASTVADLGGGTGGFLAGILGRHPRLRGMLYDLPHVVSGAGPVLTGAGVADRCAVLGGDLFDRAPRGADVYVLKTVLPGFTDDEAVRLLGNVAEAMEPGARLVLLEAVRVPGDAYDVAKLFDVHTMVLTGGRHRTREQNAALLERAGLRLVRVVPTATLTVLEGELTAG